MTVRCSRDGRKEYERLSPNAAVLIHALQSSMARGTTLSVRDQETQVRPRPGRWCPCSAASAGRPETNEPLPAPRIGCVGGLPARARHQAPAHAARRYRQRAPPAACEPQGRHGAYARSRAFATAIIIAGSSGEAPAFPSGVRDPVWEKVHHRVQRVQIDLNHINAARTTLSFMTSKDEFTFRAAMRLLAAMLVGGNRTIQMSLYKYFRTSRDETFFAETRDRLVRRSPTAAQS